MDEYVYAGNGWEPRINDVCECLGVATGSWDECEIKEFGNPLNLYSISPHDYTISVPGTVSPSGGTLWLIAKIYLRKRINPDNETNDVTMDDLMANLKGVVA